MLNIFTVIAEFIVGFNVKQAIVFAASTLIALFMITWAMTFLDLTTFQFVFLVIFPIIFMIIIPAIAVLVFLKTKKAHWSV